MSSSIEEEFQPPEWATKEEVIKAARHYINYWKIEAQARNSQWLQALRDMEQIRKELREVEGQNLQLRMNAIKDPSIISAVKDALGNPRG